MAHKIIQPPGWPRPKGYANGISAEGRMVIVAGQVGWDIEEQFEHSDFVGQADQALANIITILHEADARPEHIVRMTWFITDKTQYLASLKELAPIYKKHLQRHFPVMSVVEVSGLIEEGALLEIEATAVVPIAD